MTAQACTQDVAEVLDGTFQPSDSMAHNLFDEKQKYMYAVFEKTLLTDKGKALVRKHAKDYNAQKIYAELVQYFSKSTKATIDASTILSYITTAKLGEGTWKGTAHGFILHWMDQVRKYHDLNPQKAQALPECLQCTMLENAVHPITELRAVKVQAEQHKAHTGATLTYEQYTTLLQSAAQQYDRQFGAPARKPVRHVLEHEIYNEAQVDGETYYNTGEFDIDSSVAILQAYATNFAKAPQLSDSQWNQLPEHAKKIWNQLPAEAKAIILQTKPASFSGTATKQFPPRPPPSAVTPCHALTHELDTLIAYLHNLCGGALQTQQSQMALPLSPKMSLSPLLVRRPRLR